MHILIVRPGAIGDTLLTFPILKTLRTFYTNCTITFVGNPIVLPLALASGLVEETFDYDSLLWSELFASTGIRSPSLRALMRRTDYAICWLRDPDGIVQRNLHEQGRARVVVALGRPPEEERIHIVRYLARTLGIAESVDSTYCLERRNTALPNEFMQGLRPFAIHPGSGGAWKCWPVLHFATIICELWRHHIPVLLLSGPTDEERVAHLLDLVGTPPQASFLTHIVNAPLLEVASQLQCCRGYLGNDSGITHLAALLGMPTIALFGPSNPVVWHPLGPNVHMIYEPELTYLDVHSVMAHIERMLQE